MAQGLNPNDHPFATREELRRLEDRITERVRLLDPVIRDQKIQFTRIAQLQADLDLVRGVWTRLQPRTEATEDK